MFLHDYHLACEISTVRTFALSICEFVSYTLNVITVHRRTHGPRRDGLVVSVSASHAVGRGFAHHVGHTKYHHKNGTNCLHAWHAGV